MENAGVQIQLLGEFPQQAHRLGIIENVFAVQQGNQLADNFSQFGIGW
jgi:hypothetical protein